MSAASRPIYMSQLENLLIRKAHYWGGLAFMLGNLLFLSNKLNEMSLHFLSRPMPDVISGQNPGLILLGQVFLVIGYIAYYQVYAPRAGQLGKHTLRLFTGGGILLAIGHLTFMSALANYLPAAVAPYAEGLFLFVVVGVLLLVLGLISFGILTLRRPVVSHWRWLPLATGIMGFVGFFLSSGENITATFLVFRTLFALGLIGLGLSLWFEQPVQPDPVPGERTA